MTPAQCLKLMAIMMNEPLYCAQSANLLLQAAELGCEAVPLTVIAFRRSPSARLER